MSEFVSEIDCKARHTETITGIRALSDSIRALELRLYRDNGHISIQTRLDRHDQSLALLCKIVYGSVGLTLLTVGGTILAMAIRGKI